MEPTVKYQPECVLALTRAMKLGWGQWQVGSLTGAVASKKVAEAPKGSLRVDGNHPLSALAARELDCKGDVPSRWETRAK